jgi:hypothetical protein
MATRRPERHRGRGGVRGPGGVPTGASPVFALRVVVAGGLVVDAYVHADLAPSYAGGGAFGVQELFLVEAGVALAAALLVLTLDRTAAVPAAAVVAASALAAVLTSRYVDVGPLGPLPDLYEPVWYPEKVVATGAEAVALAAAVVLLVVVRRAR